MKNQNSSHALNKADRLKAIEIADERTEQRPSDLARNIGAETDGDPGVTGATHGDGNSARIGSVDVPINTGSGTSQ